MASSRAPVGGLVVAVFLSCLGLTCAFNITTILAPYPNYSQLNQWLSKTGVAEEINNRSTITILAPSNSVFQTYLNSVPNAYNEPDKIGDTLRYHVLLTYFGIAQLQEVPSNGTSVTTLLQTTGRANESQGFVTVYNNGSDYYVGHEYVDSYGNETILGNLTQQPYSYSVLEISSVLAPVPTALPSPAPAPSPLSAVSTPAPSTVASGPGAQTVPVGTPPSEPSYAVPKSFTSPVVLLAMLLAWAAAML